MDLNDDDLIATKLDNGTMKISQLLDYWYIKYNISKWQIDFAKNYIRNLEERNEQ